MIGGIGSRRPDHFFGLSPGTGVGLAKVLFDVAYEFRTGTVTSEATDTTVR